MKRRLRRRLGRILAIFVLCLVGTWLWLSARTDSSNAILLGKRLPRVPPNASTKRLAWPRVALVSTTTAAYARRYEGAIFNKVLYARKWSPWIDFLLDSYPYHWTRSAMSHQRLPERREPLPPHYNRLFALERLLQQRSLYDWFMYLDVDAVITNFSIPVQRFLNGTSPRHHVVVHDGPEINSGAFLLRASPESLQFVRNWIQLGTRWPQASLDQTALWHLLYLHAAYAHVDGAALLRYAHEYPCQASLLFPEHFDHDRVLQRSPATMLRRIEACWRFHMARLGLGYGHRNQMQDMVVFYRNGVPGFNFYASVGRPGNCALRHPVQLWRPGDWLVQDSGYGLEENYVTVNETVRVHCSQPPCLDEIWQHANCKELLTPAERQEQLIYRLNEWHGRHPDDSKPYRDD
ncbi:hypothetical protein CCYA_CCYA18G4518 [Cyanidiococcus yangmingshanensis]|nr:hypothetical protein CCYA_CCYA18G4518 [Cyanidiococcus yangmingshanensis]